MKKIFVWGLASLLILSACSGEETAPPQGDDTAIVTPSDMPLSQADVAEKPPQDTKEAQDDFEHDKKLFEKALEQKKVSFCTEMKDFDYQERCKARVAETLEAEKNKSSE